ncbi:MAG: hypothetical protein ABEK42_13650, partial [Thiohalorhabdaceae bacterium]
MVLEPRFLANLVGALGAAAILLPAPVSGASSDPVTDGLEAYLGGEFEAAMDHWEGPAKAGDARAQ